MKNYKQLWIVMPFLLTIFGIGILNMLSREKVESLTENRTLQQKPGIENIINKDYASLYETYYTDQFVKRDSLLKLYTKLDIMMNKSTIRGYYVINNEWIMPKKVVEQKNEEIKNIANKLNTFSKSISRDGRDIYYVSTPCKSQALNHLYPAYSEKGFTLQNMSKFGNDLNKKYIKFINIDRYFYNNFSNKEKEKMYFKTDHHWNELGAFEGFKYIIENMNILNEKDKYLISNSNFKKYEEKDKDFIGSYNRNLFYLFSKDEDIPYVKSKQRKPYEYLNYNGVEYDHVDEKLIIAPSRYSKEITYGGAYTNDNPLYKIINKSAPINKKILIVRDSYQAPTTLLFADLFKSVEILDPRNTIGVTVSKTIKESNPDIVMFMFNSETYGGMVDIVK